MINYGEIAVANCTGALLMAFLLLTRKENKENKQIGEWLYDMMIWITLFSCAIETVTFLEDGFSFPGIRFCSYFLNTLLFLGTCTVGFLWCLYVDFRIYHSIRRMKRYARILSAPLVIDMLLLLANLFHPGIIFSISAENVYQRGNLTVLTYLFLFFYFIFSIAMIVRSWAKGIRVKFFPILYFVVPCILGTVLQGLYYGIALGWLSVAFSLLFVYILLQNENSFVDALTGLYNRKYLDYVLSVINRRAKKDFFGIMIDMDDFKKINDTLGHSAGDAAIRNAGKILSRVMPDCAIAIRYAGDEFILLLQTEEEQAVVDCMRQIEEQAEKFNSGSERYTLSFSMGSSVYRQKNGDLNVFLQEMDERMYEQKRKKKVGR